LLDSIEKISLSLHNRSWWFQQQFILGSRV